MADISAEIAAFRDAAYGEEVRGSMISLANKLNNNIVDEISDMESDWDDYKDDVDDVLASALVKKPLPDVTELSDVVSAGIYYINSATSSNITDFPTMLSYDVYGLIVFDGIYSDGVFVIQFLIPNVMEHYKGIWYRIIQKSTHVVNRDWQLLVSSSTELDLFEYRGITSGNKLSEFTTGGTYAIDGHVNAHEYDDWPLDAPSMGVYSLMNINNIYFGGAFTIQFLIRDVNPSLECWFRILHTRNKDVYRDWTLVHVGVNDSHNLTSMASDQFDLSLSGQYLDFEKESWIVDHYISTKSGIIMSNSAGYAYTYFKIFNTGTYIIYISSRFGTNTGLPLFDKNKTFISYIGPSQTNVNRYFSFDITEKHIASGAVYIGINGDLKNDIYLAAIYYESDSYALLPNYPALPNFKPKSNPLYKSVLVTDGDSIMQAVNSQEKPKQISGWYGRLTKMYSMSGHNYAIGGGTFASEIYTQSGSPRHWVSTSIDQIYVDYPVLDYFIVCAGTNDADLIGNALDDSNLPAKFGSYTEDDYSGEYDITTFCGAVEYVFYKMITYWPNSKLGYIIPHSMGLGTTNKNRRKYYDTAKKIANKWRIPVLDLWYNCHLDRRLQSCYDDTMTPEQNVSAKHPYYDGQHLTSYGYDLTINMVDEWINTL